MAEIPKFGFSAYLKLINANPRPQRSIIRDRYRPSKGGYDFHKSLRQRIQQIAFDGLSLEAALASTQAITKSSEKASAVRALERSATWKEANPGALQQCDSLLFSSPGGLFKVEFTPNFLLEINGRRTAVHIWNTQHTLSGNLTRAALCAVASRFPTENRPDDFAVLSLQNSSIFLWSEADRSTSLLGERLLGLLDLEFANARVDLGLPSISEGDAPTPHL